MKIITYLLLIGTFFLTSCYTKFAAEADNSDDYGYRYERSRDQSQTQYNDATNDSTYYNPEYYDEDDLGYDNSYPPQIDISITSDYRPWSLHRNIYVNDYRWRHHIIIDPIIYIDPYYASFYTGYYPYYDPWDNWWDYPGYVAYPGYPAFYPYYPAYGSYYGPYYGYWDGYGGYGRYTPPIIRKTPRSFDDRHPSTPIRHNPRPGSGTGNSGSIASRPVYRPIGNGGSVNRNGGRDKGNRPDRKRHGKRIIHRDDHGSHMSGLARGKSNRPTQTVKRASNRVEKRKYKRHYYNITDPVRGKAPRTIRAGQRAPRRTKYLAPKINMPKKSYRPKPSKSYSGRNRSQTPRQIRSTAPKVHKSKKSYKNRSTRRYSGRSGNRKQSNAPVYRAPSSNRGSSSGSGNSHGYRSTPRSSSSGSSGSHSAPRSRNTQRSHRR